MKKVLDSDGVKHLIGKLKSSGSSDSGFITMSDDVASNVRYRIDSENTPDMVWYSSTGSHVNYNCLMQNNSIAISAVYEKLSEENVATGLTAKVMHITITAYWVKDGSMIGTYEINDTFYWPSQDTNRGNQAFTIMIGNRHFYLFRVNEDFSSSIDIYNVDKDGIRLFKTVRSELCTSCSIMENYYNGFETLNFKFIGNDDRYLFFISYYRYYSEQWSNWYHQEAVYCLDIENGDLSRIELSDIGRPEYAQDYYTMKWYGFVSLDSYGIIYYGTAATDTSTSEYLGSVYVYPDGTFKHNARSGITQKCNTGSTYEPQSIYIHDVDPITSDVYLRRVYWSSWSNTGGATTRGGDYYLRLPGGETTGYTTTTLFYIDEKVALVSAYDSKLLFAALANKAERFIGVYDASEMSTLYFNSSSTLNAMKNAASLGVTNTKISAGISGNTMLIRWANISYISPEFCQGHWYLSVAYENWTKAIVCTDNKKRLIWPVLVADSEEET